MTRQDYIKHHAGVLKSQCDRREKLSKRGMEQELTPKARQKLSADLNWLGMEIEQTKERLAFALGYLIPENAQKEYRPSSFHTYKGIQVELERTKFD